jgi:ATP-dependent DNA helicase 2 subunit 1
MTKEEIQQIKKFDTPSLKLMGFKPRSRLKEYHNYKASYFLYPDEDVLTSPPTPT